MSVKANPTDAAASWVQGMQGASTKYIAGVNAVKTSPGALAAAAAPLWAANVAQAQPKFAANVAKVTLAAWQADAINKGAPRLGTGASNAQPKFAAFMTSFIPQLAQVVAGLPARGSFDANVARFTAYATALHQKAGTF